ncbi:hypothetical protein D3C74_495990 [compost metagenome]
MQSKPETVLDNIPISKLYPASAVKFQSDHNAIAAGGPDFHPADASEPELNNLRFSF